MHKGIICLLRAPKANMDPVDAREAVRSHLESWLEQYKYSVWDWYQIGGRWTGLLDGYDPYTDPDNQETCSLCKGTGMRNDKLGRMAREENPEYTCNGCDGKGTHVKWPTSFKEHINNIMPLSECIEVVKKYKSTEKKIKNERKYFFRAIREEIWNKIKYFFKRKPYKIHTWRYAYYIQTILNLKQEELCFETDVYNWEDGDYSIPEDMTDWWAIILDIHN